MCYSAQARQEHKRFMRETGSKMDIKEYLRLFWDWRENGSPYKFPKAMLDGFANPQTPEEDEIWRIIQEKRAEQAMGFEQELFKQKKRLADAERTLQSKQTKKALDDQRIASIKISQLKGKIDDLKRLDALPRDSRIFPGSYSTVMVSQGGARTILPMRYQCRPHGKPAFYDKKYPGTYNARRDNLRGFWKELFGYNHAIMVCDTFYENVTGEDGKNRVLQFTPRTGEPMYVACLWSRWTDPKGVEPDLLSFAAVTDEPEPEVAAAGHDRTIINIKPEHIDAWLNPDREDLQAMQDIFDDRQHPYYEHREAA